MMDVQQLIEDSEPFAVVEIYAVEDGDEVTWIVVANGEVQLVDRTVMQRYTKVRIQRGLMTVEDAKWAMLPYLVRRWVNKIMNEKLQKFARP